MAGSVHREIVTAATLQNEKFCTFSGTAHHRHIAQPVARQCGWEALHNPNDSRQDESMSQGNELMISYSPCAQRLVSFLKHHWHYRYAPKQGKHPTPFLPSLFAFLQQWTTSEQETIVMWTISQWSIARFCSFLLEHEQRKGLHLGCSGGSCQPSNRDAWDQLIPIISCISVCINTSMWAPVCPDLCTVTCGCPSLQHQQFSVPPTQIGNAP